MNLHDVCQSVVPKLPSTQVGCSLLMLFDLLRVIPEMISKIKNKQNHGN